MVQDQDHPEDNQKKQNKNNTEAKTRMNKKRLNSPELVHNIERQRN